MTGGHRRRDGDDGWRKIVRENWYRDVWLLLVSALVLFAVLKSVAQTGEIQDGRRVGTSVTCATTSAIIDKGRETLSNSATIRPSEFEENLIRLGLPPKRARQAAADRAAREYGLAIARAVAKQTGRDDVVSKDGTLNCAALRKATGTN